MFRYTVLIILILLFCGCASNNAYDYADYSRSFETEMTFYSQYEIIYKAKTNRKEKLVVAPFLSDSNQYLPEEIVKLHFGLIVVNPKREKFTIWMDYSFNGIGNDEFKIKKSKIVAKSQSLPEEFISIDLPHVTNTHAQVKILIEVVGSEKVIYSTKALYKTKGSKKS